MFSTVLSGRTPRWSIWVWTFLQSCWCRISWCSCGGRSNPTCSLRSRWKVKCEWLIWKLIPIWGYMVDIPGWYILIHHTVITFFLGEFIYDIGRGLTVSPGWSCEIGALHARGLLRPQPFWLGETWKPQSFGTQKVKPWTEAFFFVCFCEALTTLREILTGKSTCRQLDPWSGSLSETQ